VDSLSNNESQNSLWIHSPHSEWLVVEGNETTSLLLGGTSFVCNQLMRFTHEISVFNYVPIYYSMLCLNC
jgi:hypothetical protein